MAETTTPRPDAVELLHEACDLLAERKHGNPARSLGHNARLCVEDAIKALTHVPDPGKERPAEAVEALWQELQEVDDRTSPAEYPDKCLITMDELAGFIARARPETALAYANPWVSRVFEVREEAVGASVGAWVACSGCQESEDGHVSTRDYPYSAVFGCQPSGGCSECGGLGVKWDDTDWDEAARFMIDDMAATDREERLAKAIEPFALLAPDTETGGANMGDPLSKWFTIAQLVEAQAALRAAAEARP